MKKYTRREVILAMGVGALGASSGCCRIAPRINESASVPLSRLSDSFTPLVGNSFSIIDAHAHFFNATDMQAGGFLAGPIANEWGVVGPLMNIVSTVIDGIARSIAPSTHKEWLYLNVIDSDIKGLDSDGVLLRLDEQINESNREISGYLYKELSKTKFPAEYKKLIDESGFENNNLFEFNENTIYQAITNEFENVKSLKTYTDKKFKFDPREVTAIFSFLGNMLSYRLHNIRKYHKAYTNNNRLTNVVKAADALVDFDYWVGDCDNAYSSMQDQIYLHERLANITDNYVFPIAAYNPWTAIIDNNHYLDMVEDAIEYRGFKGVKIYPPIGYFPMGNSEPGSYPEGKHPDLNELDRALNDLYDLCESKNVPVMAHGNHSMGRNDQHKVMSGPDGWKKVFEKENMQSLKVNIGHFGANHKSGIGQSWPESFLALMKENPNLFADIGMWTDLSTGKDIEYLKSLLNHNITPQRKASERIMFGTDWFMLSQNPDWKSYPDNIFKNLQSAGVGTSVLKKLFNGNAKELFNL